MLQDAMRRESYPGAGAENVNEIWLRKANCGEALRNDAHVLVN
jgi:hypothetical protein